MKEKIEAAIQQVTEVVENDGFYLISHQERTAAGRLHFYVESANGIKVNECSYLMKQIRQLPEVEDLLENGFEVQLSSPGFERPLRYPFQYALHVGRVVQISLKNQTKFKGKLIYKSSDYLGLQIDLGKNQRKLVCYPLAEIEKTILDV